MPYLYLGKFASDDECDALLTQVRTRSHQTATIAVSTASVASALSPSGNHGCGLLLRLTADLEEKPAAGMPSRWRLVVSMKRRGAAGRVPPADRCRYAGRLGEPRRRRPGIFWLSGFVQTGRDVRHGRRCSSAGDCSNSPAGCIMDFRIWPKRHSRSRVPLCAPASGVEDHHAIISWTSTTVAARRELGVGCLVDAPVSDLLAGWRSAHITIAGLRPLR